MIKLLLTKLKWCRKVHCHLSILQIRK